MLKKDFMGLKDGDYFVTYNGNKCILTVEGNCREITSLGLYYDKPEYKSITMYYDCGRKP